MPTSARFASCVCWATQKRVHRRKLCNATQRRHPAAYRGAFACADPLATQIWMHAAYTLRLCMRDVTVDGLKRDRLPWVGDLHLSLIGNAFAEHRLFLRTLLALYHPHPGEVNFSGIFDFTLFWVIAAGNYFL